MTIPKYVKTELIKSYKNPGMYGFSIISDSVQAWLTNALGVFVDSPIFNIAGSQVQFRWSTQRWHIPN